MSPLDETWREPRRRVNLVRQVLRLSRFLDDRARRAAELLRQRMNVDKSGELVSWLSALAIADALGLGRRRPGRQTSGITDAGMRATQRALMTGTSLTLIDPFPGRRRAVPGCAAPCPSFAPGEGSGP